MLDIMTAATIIVLNIREQTTVTSSECEPNNRVHTSLFRTQYYCLATVIHKEDTLQRYQTYKCARVCALEFQQHQASMNE